MPVSVGVQCQIATADSAVQVDTIPGPRAALSSTHRQRRRKAWEAEDRVPAAESDANIAQRNGPSDDPDDVRREVVAAAAAVEHKSHLLLEMKRRLVAERMDVLERREAHLTELARGAPGRTLPQPAALTPAPHAAGAAAAGATAAAAGAGAAGTAGAAATAVVPPAPFAPHSRAGHVALAEAEAAAAARVATAGAAVERLRTLEATERALLTDVAALSEARPHRSAQWALAPGPAFDLIRTGPPPMQPPPQQLAATGGALGLAAGHGPRRASWGRPVPAAAPAATAAVAPSGAATAAAPFRDVVAPDDVSTAHVLQHQFLANRRAGR